MNIAEAGHHFMELSKLLLEVENEMELLKEALNKAQEDYQRRSTK